MVSNDSANAAPTPAITTGWLASEKRRRKRPFRPTGTHRLVGCGAQHRAQIGPAEHQQEHDRYPCAGLFEPVWRRPFCGAVADDGGDQRHDHAVAERKQEAGPARQARPLQRIEAGHAIDRGQVVGIHAMLHAQHEHHQHEAQPILRHCVHHFRSLSSGAAAPSFFQEQLVPQRFPLFALIEHGGRIDHRVGEAVQRAFHFQAGRARGPSR